MGGTPPPLPDDPRDAQILDDSILTTTPPTAEDRPRKRFTPEETAKLLGKAPEAAPAPTPPKDESFMGKLKRGATAAAEKGAAFLGPFNDEISMGWWNRAGDAAGQHFTEDMNRRTAENPNTAALGRGTGMAASAVGGPAAIAEKGAAKLVGKVAEKSIPRVLQAGARGAIVGAEVGAARAGGHGADVPEMLQQAKEGGEFGGVAGGFLENLSQAARGTGALLRKDAWIGPYSSARNRLEVNPTTGEQQVVNSYKTNPDLKRIKPGEAATQEASDIARDRIVKRDAELVSTAGKAHGETVDQILAKMPEKSPEAIVSKLTEMSAANRLGDGTVRDPSLETAISDTFRRLGIKPSGLSNTKDLLETRRSLRADAGFGSTARTPENRAAGELHEAVGKPLHEDVPGLKEADAKYAAAKTASRRRNDILASEENGQSRGGRPAGDEGPSTSAEDLRAGKERQMSAFLKTAGDRNVPGLARKQQMDELSTWHPDSPGTAGDPEVGRSIDMIKDVKAREANSFGVSGKVPWTLTKLLGLPGIGFAAQNARAIGGKLLEPGARALEGATSVSGVNGQPGTFSVGDLKLDKPTGGGLATLDFIQALTAAARRKREGRAK